MKKNLLKLFSKFSLLFYFLFLSPIIAFANHMNCIPPAIEIGDFCDLPPVPGIGSFISDIGEILNSIIPLMIALAGVYVVWGVVSYIIADEEEAKKKGRSKIVYGIIGLAIIISLWGLVNLVVKTFFPDTISPPSIPALTGSSTGCNFIGNSNPTFQNLLCYITGIINDSIIPLIFALAVVSFVWGTVQFFILNAEDEKKREQGRQFMIWGVVALAVMLSVWGLVEMLGSTFDIDTSVLPRVTPPPP